MRRILVASAGMAAVLMAGAASAEPSFDYTRANEVTNNAGVLEIAWSGNGKQSQAEIRFSEDPAVSRFRVINNVGRCTRAAGEHGGLSCSGPVQNLQPGKKYYFRAAVKWRGADGEHETLGPVASFSTPAVAPRTPPEVIQPRVDAYADTWAKFEYAVHGFNQRLQTGVRCQAANAPAVQSGTQNHEPFLGYRAIRVQVDGLKPSTAYTCTITAVSDAGTGSATLSVKTDSP